MVIFHSYVSLPEGIMFDGKHPLLVLKLGNTTIFDGGVHVTWPLSTALFQESTTTTGGQAWHGLTRDGWCVRHGSEPANSWVPWAELWRQPWGWFCLGKSENIVYNNGQDMLRFHPRPWINMKLMSHHLGLHGVHDPGFHLMSRCSKVSSWYFTMKWGQPPISQVIRGWHYSGSKSPHGSGYFFPLFCLFSHVFLGDFPLPRAPKTILNQNPATIHHLNARGIPHEIGPLRTARSFDTSSASASPGSDLPRTSGGTRR